MLDGARGIAPTGWRAAQHHRAAYPWGAPAALAAHGCAQGRRRGRSVSRAPVSAARQGRVGQAQSGPFGGSTCPRRTCSLRQSSLTVGVGCGGVIGSCGTGVGGWESGWHAPKQPSLQRRRTAGPRSRTRTTARRGCAGRLRSGSAGGCGCRLARPAPYSPGTLRWAPAPRPRARRRSRTLRRTARSQPARARSA
jgi:hypothetical protein